MSISYSERLNYLLRMWLSRKITQDVDVVDGGNEKDPLDFYKESVSDWEGDESERQMNYVIFLRWLNEKHHDAAPLS